jgi:hypothetical protein
LQVSKYKHVNMTDEQQFENVLPAGLPLPGLKVLQ